MQREGIKTPLCPSCSLRFFCCFCRQLLLAIKNVFLQNQRAGRLFCGQQKLVIKRAIFQNQRLEIAFYLEK